jgi:2'-5' RNA ligase
LPAVPANLFVAVVPPPEATAELAATVEQLRASAPDLAWVAPDRWHVTICFLGPVEPSGELRERLARVARRHPPPTLRVAGGGRFGDRVLWARLEGDLRAVAAGVTRAAERAGYAVEDRPFRAHLTLARGRRTRVDLRPLAAALADVGGPVWTAEELALMRGGSPRYLRLAGWPFTGSEPLC